MGIKGKKDHLYYATIGFVLLFCLLLMGKNFYYLTSDSETYLSYTRQTGVMPFYQIFLRMNRAIFGEERFLYAVVIEQTLVALVCLILFFHFLRRNFEMGRLESIPLLIVLIVPFTINLPDSMVNREILTEAFAYPLFYIYMIFLLKAVMKKTKAAFLRVWILSCVLALVRTQLQLTFVITAVCWFYIGWRQCDGKRVKEKLLRLGLLFIEGLSIVVLSMLIVMSVNRVGQVIMSATGSQQNRAVAQSGSSNMTRQYNSILTDKALYEMDYEDYRLFLDEEVRQLYLHIYQKVDENKSRYVYAREGLWKWQDIMNGIAGGTAMASAGIKSYKIEFPESKLDCRQALTDICWRLIGKHWGRIIYHILCMAPVSLVCTVFFQIEKIYLFCHLFTFMLYIIAILIIFVDWKKKMLPQNYAEAMAACIVTNFIFVFMMIIMFFGMQRYLIYGFGTFWSMFYILLNKLFACLIGKRQGIRRGDIKDGSGRST